MSLAGRSDHRWHRRPGRLRESAGPVRALDRSTAPVSKNQGQPDLAESNRCSNIRNMRASVGTGAGGDHRVTADAGSRTDAVPHRHVACCHCRCDAEAMDDGYVPDDLYHLTGSGFPDDARFVTEQDQWDAELDELLGRNRRSRVDDLEWDEWHGIDQDDAERALLALEAPPWVFLPPGGQLATALEDTCPQTMSPIALIELMKAATRQTGWIEALKAEAIASFIRQRRAEHATHPRPTHYDTNGRPIDPERSWYAELALALGVTKETIARRATTALRLTGPLRATHTALQMRRPHLEQSPRHLRSHRRPPRPRRPSRRSPRAETRRVPNPQEHAGIAAPPGRQTPCRRGRRRAPRRRRRPHLQNRPPAQRHGRAVDRQHRRQNPANVGHHPSPRHPRQTPRPHQHPGHQSVPHRRGRPRRRDNRHTTPTDTTPAPAPAPADTGPPTASPPAQPGPGTTDDAAITTSGDGAINDAPDHHDRLRQAR